MMSQRRDGLVTSAALCLVCGCGALDETARPLPSSPTTVEASPPETGGEAGNGVDVDVESLPLVGTVWLGMASAVHSVSTVSASFWLREPISPPTTQLGSCTIFDNESHLPGKVRGLDAGTVTVSAATEIVSLTYDERIQAYPNGQIAAGPTKIEATGANVPAFSVAVSPPAPIEDLVIDDAVGAPRAVRWRAAQKDATLSLTVFGRERGLTCDAPVSAGAVTIDEGALRALRDDGSESDGGRSLRLSIQVNKQVSVRVGEDRIVAMYVLVLPDRTLRVR